MKKQSEKFWSLRLVNSYLNIWKPVLKLPTIWGILSNVVYFLFSGVSHNSQNQSRAGIAAASLFLIVTVTETQASLTPESTI